MEHKSLDHQQAESEGWFSGPPFAVAESVFNESDLAGCTPRAISTFM